MYFFEIGRRTSKCRRAQTDFYGWTWPSDFPCRSWYNNKIPNNIDVTPKSKKPKTSSTPKYKNGGFQGIRSIDEMQRDESDLDLSKSKFHGYVRFFMLTEFYIPYVLCGCLLFFRMGYST